MAQTPGRNTGRRCSGSFNHLSGSKELPRSPAREKQGKLPPSNPGQQGDLWDHLSWRHRQASQEGSSASPQAKSRGTSPKHQGGVGHHGSPQSSSHHRGTSQGQGSSSVWFLPGLHQLPQSLLAPWQPTLWVKALRSRRPVWPGQEADRRAGQGWGQKGEILFLLKY